MALMSETFELYYPYLRFKNEWWKLLKYKEEPRICNETLVPVALKGIQQFKKYPKTDFEFFKIKF